MAGADPADRRHSPQPTPDELRQLVDAVVARQGGNGLVVDAHNGSGGWRPVVELLVEDACFAVDVAPTLLALDQDDPASLEGLATVFDACRAAGVEPVVVASGGTSRHHLFARVADPVLHRTLGDLARTHGIDVRTSSPIRPPGVRHRSGARPRLVSHGSWAAALDALGPRPDAARIPDDLWRLITRGDTAGRYRDPATGRTDASRMTMAICNKAVLAGIDPQRVWHLLRDRRNAGGASVQRRLDSAPGSMGHQRARRFFDRTWARATETSWKPRTFTTREGALEELDRLEALHQALVFTGRTANSDRAVTDAVFTMARRYGGPVVPVSVRALALESGLDTKTCSKALTRAKDEGRFQIVRCSAGERSAVYRICEPTVPDTGTRQAPTPSLSVGGRGTVGFWREGPGHDAFSAGALGKAAYRVLVALLDGGLVAAELSARTGLRPRSLPAVLGRLRAHGLVERLDDGTWTCPVDPEGLQEALDLAAEACGSAGRGERRRFQFGVERAAYRRYLAELEARRAVEQGPAPRGPYDGGPTRSQVAAGADGTRGPPPGIAA